VFRVKGSNHEGYWNEAGKMQLHCTEINIVEWVRTYIQSFESLARQRKIDFVFEAEQPEIKCFFDPEKMAHVLNTLLSNAFKFTKSGGRISVTVHSSRSAVHSRQFTVRSSQSAVHSPQSAVGSPQFVVGSSRTEDWRLETEDWRLKTGD